MKDLIREFQSYPAIGVKMLSYKREIKATRVGLPRGLYFLHFSPIQKKHSEIVMYIHGGGWNSKCPKDFEFIGQRIASEGYECVITGYRKVPRVHFNEIIDDVCLEYKAVLQYFKKREINADRVIVMGSSAGAHLGSLLVYDKEIHKKYKIGTKRFAGFISLAGPLCFQGKSTWVLKQLLSDLFEKGQDQSVGEPYSRLDLLTADDTTELSIPMFLIQSEHDGVLNLDQTLLFARKAMEMNIPVTFYRVTDSKNTHTSYSTAVFFDDLGKSKTLQTIFSYLDQLSTDYSAD